jgi:hypothetical protein
MKTKHRHSNRFFGWIRRFLSFDSAAGSRVTGPSSVTARVTGPVPPAPGMETRVAHLASSGPSSVG